jgi:hypothetical protein
MTEDNIYTVSLKYGVDNLNSDVTYNKLLAHLKSQNITLDKDLLRYFHVWFYESFYVDAIYPKIKDFKWTGGDLCESILSQFDDKKAIITGSSHQTYQDYQELKVAYKSSKDASKFAIIAICVTLLVGLIQIAITLLQNCKNIKPH